MNESEEGSKEERVAHGAATSSTGWTIPQDRLTGLFPSESALLGWKNERWSRSQRQGESASWAFAPGREEAPPPEQI